MKKIFICLMLILGFSRQTLAQSHDFSKLICTIIESNFSELTGSLNSYGDFTQHNGILKNDKYGISISQRDEKFQRIEIVPTENLLIEKRAINLPQNLKSTLSIVPTRYYKRNYIHDLVLINDKVNILKIRQETDSSTVEYFFKIDTTFFKDNEIIREIDLYNSFEDIQYLQLPLMKVVVHKFKFGNKYSLASSFNISSRYYYQENYADSAKNFLLKRLSIVDKNNPTYLDILYLLYEINKKQLNYNKAAKYMQMLIFASDGNYKKGYTKLMEVYTLAGKRKEVEKLFNKYYANFKEVDERFKMSFYHSISNSLWKRGHDYTDLIATSHYLGCCFNMPGIAKQESYFEEFLEEKKLLKNLQIKELIKNLKSNTSLVYSIEIENYEISSLKSSEMDGALISKGRGINIRDEKAFVESENIYTERDVSIKPKHKFVLNSISNHIVSNLVLPPNINVLDARIKLTIRGDGTLSDVAIDSKLPAEYTNRIKQILLELQGWSPAYRYNIPVDYRMEEFVYHRKK